MRELKQRQKLKKIAYSLPVLALFCILAFILIRGAVRVVYKQMDSSKHVEELRVEAQALTSRGEELENRIRRLDTEEGLEEEIKEKFNVSLEGEEVVILVDESSSKEKATSTEGVWYEDFLSRVKGLWER